MQEHINDMLSPYMDHELSTQETTVVEDHLQYCGYCQAEYKKMKQIKNELIQTYKEMQPSEQLTQNIFNGIAASRREKLYIRSTLTAIIFGAVLISFLFLQFLTVFKTIWHLAVMIFKIFQAITSSMITLLANNAYIMTSVIIGGSILIILMLIVLKFLLSSSVTEPRRRTS